MATMTQIGLIEMGLIRDKKLWQKAPLVLEGTARDLSGYRGFEHTYRVGVRVNVSERRPCGHRSSNTFDLMGDNAVRST